MYQHILVTNHQCHRLQGHVTCSADYLLVDAQGATSLLHRVTFRFAWEGDFSPVGGEAYLTVGLFPAMRLGLPLVSDQPVAPGFEESFGRLQDIILAWFPGNELRKVPLKTSSRPLLSHKGRGTAALFSGGVDSFHTIHQHQHQIDRLVYIEGFDTGLHQTQYRQLAQEHMRDAARELNLPLTVVETDARLFLDRFANWRFCATMVSGAVLQLFTPVFHRALVGGSHTWSDRYIHADGYLLTEQTGLADMNVILDAMHRSRHAKVVSLASCPAALRHLRVCWEMPPNQLNCGACEKCLRTMTALASHNLLEKCSTLPRHLDWEKVNALVITSERVLRMWEAREAPCANEEAQHQLEAFIAKARARLAAQRFWEAGKGLSHASGWPLLARKLGKPLLQSQATHAPEWLARKVAQNSETFREALWKSFRSRPQSLTRAIWNRIRQRFAA